jgi:acyl dehydratase
MLLPEGVKMKLTVGQTATRSLSVTAEHVDLYAKITGDRNPLHFDEAFAAKTKFGRLVVHGGITAGILNALVAEDMPGPGTVFMSQELKYTAPVFVGDTITATGEVREVHASKPVCRLGVVVTRAEGEVVLEGECWCYTFSPS